MIQFNLLPTVKAEYLRTKRLKRIISLVSALVIAVCVGILAILFTIVFVIQPRMLNNLDKSIKSVANDIKSTKDINKVLTIQNQLIAVSGLHDQKPRAERLFTFLTQTTPANISIESFDVDISSSKINVSAQAKTVVDMNKYVDILKFTDVNYGDDSTPETKAFSLVVLNSYAVSEDGVAFSVSFGYVPDILSVEKSKLKLVVPNITSTRSETERPTDLFKINTTPDGNED